MKKKILLPIFTLAFFACLVFAAVIPARTNASAEETSTPSCEIVAESLQLKDNVYILYAVDFKNTQSTDSTGLLVWEAPQTNYTHTNANTVLTTSKTENIDGVDYAAFTYTKLSAKQMTDVVYASAYVERNDTYYYGSVIKYSILEYAYNKLGLTEAVPTEDESLKSLINAMLAYGSAAQTHFDYKTDNLASSEDFTYVRISNAKFEDGFNYGLFKAGSTVTVTPDEGYGLSVSGSTIFTENANGTLTLTVPADKTIDETSIAKKSTVSEGLTYALSSDNLSYSVTGVGTCEDTAIIIPSTYNGKPVKSISSEAFQNNATLTSVTIPENVTNIGVRAFNNCSNLTSVTIPESVTEFSADAFMECTALTRVNFGDLDAWCGISFANKEANPLYYAHNLYLNGVLLEDLVVPKSITEIQNRAFSGATCIKTVTIPTSFTKFGTDAFINCTALTRVNFGDLDAWYGISFANKAANPLYYAHNLYINDELLEDLVVPDSITEIQNRAFSGATCIKTVTIPTSFTKFGNEAFINCTALTRVNISSIGAWCGISFGGLDANPLYYAHNLYLNGELLENLIVPDGVTKIEKYAFLGATCIKTVTIPASVKKIASSFDNCTGLIGVYITDIKAWIDIEMGSLNSLLQYAKNLYLNNVLVEDLVLSAADGYTKVKNFYGARCLKSVTLPEGITEICQYAFKRCSNLKTINIPTTLKTIGSGAFEECTSLEYNVHDNAKYLGNTQNPYLMLVKATNTSITSCTIHPNTKIIGSQAFRLCKDITAITIPNGVTEIHEEAFRYCRKLESITIPDSVTKLEAYAFEECDELSSVKIGTGVTEIGKYAFGYCPKLTSVVIPNGVTKISDRLFEGCTALTEITIGGNVNKIYFYILKDCTALTTIYFGGTIEQWKKIDKETYWKTDAGATVIVDGKQKIDFTVVCTDGNLSKDEA